MLFTQFIVFPTVVDWVKVHLSLDVVRCLILNISLSPVPFIDKWAEIRTHHPCTITIWEVVIIFAILKRYDLVWVGGDL